MTVKKQKKRSASRRKKRRSIVKRLFGLLIASILVIGIGGLGIWLLWDRQPETTVMTYPMEYEEQIRKYAADNNLEPAYVAAVVLAESSYRTDAVSAVNAQGLMQILPDTGSWLAGKFDETYVEGCLFDPDTNLRYGCWYLGWLMNRYDGEMKCASAAYHQGQGTVDNWLQNPEYSTDGKTLINIPSEATRTYVDRILNYYEKYEEIYG